MPWQPWAQQFVDRYGRSVGRGWWVVLGLILVLGCGGGWIVGKLSGGGILGVAVWLSITISLCWLLLALIIRLGLHFEPPAGPISPPPWRSIWIGWLMSLGFVLVPLISILIIGEVWGEQARLAAVFVCLIYSLCGSQILRWLRRRRHQAQK